jgi:uncharacterized protein (TIGR03083 family)
MTGRAAWVTICGMSDIGASIAAWRHSLDAVLAVGATFTADDWGTATECPEWTVKDVYAHIIGGERWMSAGHPVPAGGMASVADEPVVARRDHPGPAVLAELREVYALRVAQLATDPPHPDEPTQTAFGLPVTVGTLYQHRAFDIWVHEQDIRRAIGQPGNLDSPAALITRDILLLTLALVVAKRSAAPAGSLTRFTVSGPVEFERWVMVDENRRGQLLTKAPPGEPTVALRMQWETFLRLAAGRIGSDQAAATVAGDGELAERILARFAVTP